MLRLVNREGIYNS